ncbi:hypothetical protein GCM10028789_23190 [Sinomonas halotolerans]
MLLAGAPFTAVELQAMAADGVVRRLIGQAYVPALAPEGPSLRARSLAALLPARVRVRAVAGRMTAAWIFGCAPAPELPVMLVASTHRISSLRSPERLLVHEVGFGPYDVLDIAGLQVTSPLRTALDVALHCEGTRAMPVLRRLLAQPGLGLTPRLVARALESLPRQPHKERARRLLERVAR